MSFNYGFNPKVLNPDLPNSRIPQMTSGAYQTPFFFGGSQVPTDLNLSSPRITTDKIGGQGIKVYIPKQKYYIK